MLQQFGDGAGSNSIQDFETTRKQDWALQQMSFPKAVEAHLVDEFKRYAGQSC